MNVDAWSPKWYSIFRNYADVVRLVFSQARIYRDFARRICASNLLLSLRFRAKARCGFCSMARLQRSAETGLGKAFVRGPRGSMDAGNANLGSIILGVADPGAAWLGQTNAALEPPI